MKICIVILFVWCIWLSAVCIENNRRTIKLREWLENVLDFNVDVAERLGDKNP